MYQFIKPFLDNEIYGAFKVSVLSKFCGAITIFHFHMYKQLRKLKTAKIYPHVFRHIHKNLAHKYIPEYGIRVTKKEAS